MAKIIKKLYLFITCLFVFSTSSALALEQKELISNLKKISDSLNIAKEEYREGVNNGKVVMPEEYEEANLFVQQAQKNSEKISSFLGADKTKYQELTEKLNLIALQVKNKEKYELVNEQVTTVDGLLEAIAGTTLKEFPPAKPILADGKIIFEKNCASCHGFSGLGDGTAAKNMQPPPANFHLTDYIENKSPYSFYRAIKNGISGTAMPAWEYSLSTQEKWAVIDYIRSFHYNEEKIKNGERLFQKVKVPAQFTEFRFSADQSNFKLAEQLAKETENKGFSSGELSDLVSYLRTEKSIYPESLATASGSENLEKTVKEIRNLLEMSKQKYLEGKNEQAKEDSVLAYIAFEPVEKELAVKDNKLARGLELKFNNLKALYASAGNEEKAESLLKSINEELDLAIKTMTDKKEGLAILLQSMAIILREGFEAIIIIMALLTFTRKANNGKILAKNLGYGVGVGIVASFITAYLIETLLNNSGFSKEVIEGATILIAAAMLFYVSHWLISKTQAQKWQEFIRSQLGSAINQQSKMAIAFVGFLSVYREGFETILFYKALFNTTAEANMVSAGFVSGSIILTIIAVLFYRFSIKIPIREFFLFTGLILYYMVFSFSGKGVHELQEANLIPVTGVNFVPTIDLLGIYPSLETLLAQLLVVIFWFGALTYSFRSPENKKTQTNEEKKEKTSSKSA